MYELEERCVQFAKLVREFVKELPKTITNNEDCKQLVRSSGAVGANYIEANEALGTKDFLMRLKIARKEAKESVFWLRLVDVEFSTPLEKRRERLAQEASELKLILNAIVRKARLG